MSERMTAVSLPGGKHPGFAEWGDRTPQEMIAEFRETARSDKARAEEILAAADADFRVETFRGPYARRQLKIIQAGRDLEAALSAVKEGGSDAPC